MIESIDFEEYRGENRLLLLFAPSAGDESYRAQQEIVDADTQGFQERDLVLLRLFEEGESEAGETPVSAAAVEAARARFGVETGRFTVLLVGKDGTIKRRQHEPVSLAALYEQIDAMPMRRREIEESGR